MLGRWLVRAGGDDDPRAAEAVRLELLDHDPVEQRTELMSHGFSGLAPGVPIQGNDTAPGRVGRPRSPPVEDAWVVEIIAHRAASGGRRRPASAQSLARALSGRADRVELDVFLISGRLVIAHDREDASLPGQLTLDDALAAIGPSGRGLLADIKGDGAARPLGAALAATGLAGRTIVCGELAAVGQAGLSAGVTRAWTLPTERWPAHRRDPENAPRAPAGPIGLVTPRAGRRLERAVVEGLATGRCDAVCVERRFIGPSLVCAVHKAGGRLLAWTVDRPSEARRLAGLGVDGLITNEADTLGAFGSAGSAQWSDG